MAGSISLVIKPPIAITNKPFLFASYSIPSPPTKPALVKLVKRRRSNSLRPKILTKPYSPDQNPKYPEILAPPAEQSDEIVAVVSPGNDNGPVVVSGKYLVRYAMYLVGVFVFQTVFAVWMLGYSGSDRKVESLNGSELDKEVTFLRENSNEALLEEKVEEIRDLARKARKNEKSSKNGDLSSRSKTGIEREIGNRLLRLRKRLSSGRDKLSGSYLSHLSKSESGSEAKMGNESLMFKKKFKVRGYSGELRESPKGFGRSDKINSGGEIDGDKKSRMSQNGRRKSQGRYGVEGLETSKVLKGIESKERLVNGSVGDESTKILEAEDEGNGKGKLVQNGKKILQGKEMTGGNEEKAGNGTRKVRTGVIQESRRGTPSAELLESESSRDSWMENRVSTRENQENSEDSSAGPLLSRNESSRGNEVEKSPVSSKVPREQSKSGNDMWWLDLPCVFVILMQRESDTDGPAGLYTYDSSHVVAFVDRGDAYNLCFLLESSFEVLGDINADIIPMSVKELEAKVNSEDWEVIVVKKGQLELYAGQPLEDVNMALQALVEEAQSS